MKERKKIASIVGICGILSFLGGCQDAKTVPAQTTPTDTQIQTPNDQGTTTVSNTNVQQQLVIHPGCIGCGRCAMFAPNNFVMNGRQAQVISQENLDSPEVQQAIMSCKAQVIEIIEA